MTRLQSLLQVVRYLLGKPPFDLALAPEEDHRHTLRPEEHEAFYFLFTSSDGHVSGGLRTLFGPHEVLEMVGLRMGDGAWMHQQRVPLTSTDQADHDASGPSLKLHCLEPWQRWQARFSGRPLTIEGKAEEVQLDLTFRATTPAARFRLGAYQQSQQDGRLSGTIRTPSQRWEGELVGYRDHSWGQRGAGDIPGWMILDIPEHLYAFLIGDLRRQPFGVGRITTAEGGARSVVRPRVTQLAPGRWQIEDRRAGFPPWTFEWIGEPGISYLGPPGEEAVRSAPAEGDLFKDRIGPARFTSPTGKQVIGFWDLATRIERDE